MSHRRIRRRLDRPPAAGAKKELGAAKRAVISQFESEGLAASLVAGPNLTTASSLNCQNKSGLALENAMALANVPMNVMS